MQHSLSQQLSGHAEGSHAAVCSWEQALPEDAFTANVAATAVTTTAATTMIFLFIC